MIRRASIVALCVASGCSSSQSMPPSIDDTGTVDGTTDGSADSGLDSALDSEAAPSGLRTCPTTGKGALTGGGCFVLTPVESGLPSTGAGANEDQYALRPAGTARGVLLVFMNGSGGTPSGGIATPDSSLFSVARDAGLHVLAVSYRSADAVGVLCVGKDACFGPTRATILTGTFQAGAAASLSDMAVHEGVYARVANALATLADKDPSGGWSAFLDRPSLADPGKAIRWASVIPSGHSQGGGHAALLGKMQAVERVVMLSSPCDAVAGTPATWLTKDGSFATDPSTRFFGIGAPGDAICPAYAGAWKALAMPPSASRADATLCTGSAAHAATIKCAENAPLWNAALK
jgi:hypothetical protein